MSKAKEGQRDGAGREAAAPAVHSGRYLRRAQWFIGLLILLGLLVGPAAAQGSTATTIFKIGSDVTVEKGQTLHSVFTIGGQITVAGTVDKSVVAVGGSVVLTKTAVVRGSVTSLGGVIVIARDAEVGGDLTEINSTNLHETLAAALSSEWEGWSWVFAIISLAIFFVILVLALLIAALLPKPVRTVSEAIHQNTLKVVLCGILALVLIAPLALLLTISVVGIALIPLEVIFVVCSVLLGFIAVGRIVGAGVLRLFHRPNPGIVRETFWGLLILWMVGWIPYIGWMVKVIAIVIGLGATLVTRFGTYQGWKAKPCPPAAEPAGTGTAPNPALLQPPARDPEPVPPPAPPAATLPSATPAPPPPADPGPTQPAPEPSPEPPPLAESGTQGAPGLPSSPASAPPAADDRPGDAEKRAP